MKQRKRGTRKRATRKGGTIKRASRKRASRKWGTRIQTEKRDIESDIITTRLAERKCKPLYKKWEKCTKQLPQEPDQRRAAALICYQNDWRPWNHCALKNGANPSLLGESEHM